MIRRIIARLDPRYAKICVYASATVLITLAIAMVLYFSSGFFMNLWLILCAVLEPMVYGIIVAYLLNPGVVKVSHALKNAGWNRQNFRARRQVGIVVCLLALALVVSGILLVMMLVVTRSLNQINYATLQAMLNDARSEMQRLVTSLQDKAIELGIMSSEATSATGAGMAESTGSDLGSLIMGAFTSVASIGSTMVFSVIFAVYFLMDGDHVGRYVQRVARVAFGQSACDRAMGIIDDLDHVFSGYIRGQFTDALVVGVATAIVLTLVGVPMGPLVGFLTGLGNLIPYVGGPMGFLSITLLCLADGSVEKMIVGYVCLALIMSVDANIVNPRLLSDNVDVHPMLVVAALIAGSAVGGLAGMLVAVPAAAFLKLQLDRWVDRREALDETAPDEAD